MSVVHKTPFLTDLRKDTPIPDCVQVRYEAVSLLLSKEGLCTLTKKLWLRKIHSTPSGALCSSRLRSVSSRTRTVRTLPHPPFSAAPPRRRALRFHRSKGKLIQFHQFPRWTRPRVPRRQMHPQQTTLPQSQLRPIRRIHRGRRLMRPYIPPPPLLRMDPAPDSA